MTVVWFPEEKEQHAVRTVWNMMSLRVPAEDTFEPQL